ncbi:hypothetical protein CYLTODRAFT_418120, partial [Cylindrobasidium torrendii FP15055 ss-10]
MRLTSTLSAWITINGQKCEEFDTKISEDGEHATCWIPSQAGKEFVVHFADSPQTPTDYTLKLDGSKCGGKVCRMPDGLRHQYAVDGKAVGPTTIRPFSFAAIRQSDDDELLLNSIEGVGEIILNVCRATFTEGRPPKPPPAERMFHERLKKGIDHQTSYGAPILSARKTFWRPHHIGTPRTLTFKYRPLDVLRANGVAPMDATGRNNAGVKAEADVDFSDVEIIETPPDIKPDVKRKRTRTKIKHEERCSAPLKKLKREPTGDSEVIVLS